MGIKSCKNCGAGFVVTNKSSGRLCAKCCYLINTSLPDEESAIQPQEVQRTYHRSHGIDRNITVLDSNWKNQTPNSVMRFYDDMFYVVSTGKVEVVPITEVVEVQLLNTEQVKRFGGSIVGALAGGVFFGVAGATAGALSFGNSQQITLAIRFRGGGLLVGNGASDIFNRLIAFLRTNKPNGDVKLIGEPPVRILRTDIRSVMTFFGSAGAAGLFAAPLLFYAAYLLWMLLTGNSNYSSH